jgi:hypothetical protein
MNTFIQNKIKFLFKLKALDWFIVLTIAGIIIFLVATSLNQDRWITIEFKVTNNPTYLPYNGETPPYWIADKIKVGDVQTNDLGQQNLKVLSVKSWGFQNKETWVTASVKAKYNPKQKKYTYLYQPLEIGRSIDITINGTNVHGIVTSIQGFSDTRKTYDVTVKTRLTDNNTPYSVNTRGVDPWIADATEKGQIMKDTSGKPIAEILDKEVRPAEKVITTSDGRAVLGEDPLKKDVYLTVKLRVTKNDDTYLFLENIPVKIGFSFPIYLERVFLNPVITQIL